MKKIAVVSDIHDNLANLQKVLDYIKKEKIEYLICLGDCQTMDTWIMLENAPQKTYAVLGNNDEHILNEDNIKTYFKKMTVFTLWGDFEIEGKQIIISHYINVLKEILDKNEAKYSLALYGHSHKPWEEYYQNTKLLNPGNVANVRFAPTFAIINLDNLKSQLVLINEL